MSSADATARPRGRRSGSILVRGLLAALVTAGALALSPAASAAPDRPRITSFYVRDEGPVIHLKVNWCVPSYAVGNSIISTFRMWAPDGTRLVQRRISGRATRRCMNDSFKLDDIYPNGVYSANVAVTDRTLGGFIRLQARYFRIS